MALARLSVKVGKVGKAQPHAAYIARLGQYAARLEKNEKLLATEYGNMPAWAAHNPLEFWQAADCHERSNGTTYREFEIALPRELSEAEQVELIQEFVAQEIGDKHAYQWAIHVPTAADGETQPHAHVMFSERQVDGIARDPEQYFKRYNAKNPEKGGGRKLYGNVDPNLKGKARTQARADELIELRHRWEVTCNLALERNGTNARIDMRSYADRGIDKDPERKMLPSEWRKVREAVQEQRDAAQVLKETVPDLNAKVVALEEGRQAIEQTPAIKVSQEPAENDRTFLSRQQAYKQRLLTHAYQSQISEQLGERLSFVARTNKIVDIRLKDGGRIIDQGDRLKASKDDSSSEISTLIELAQVKGWKTLTVTGSDTFKRSVWEAAQLQGLAVKGYEPTEQDQQLLASKQQRQQRAAAQKPKPQIERRVQAVQNDLNKAKLACRRELEQAIQQRLKPLKQAFEDTKEELEYWMTQEPEEPRGLIGRMLNRTQYEQDYDRWEKRADHLEKEQVRQHQSYHQADKREQKQLSSDVEMMVMERHGKLLDEMDRVTKQEQQREKSRLQERQKQRDRGPNRGSGLGR